MKAPSGRQTSSLASQILKLVGIILIVSSLLDYVFLLIPQSQTNNNISAAQWSLLWQQNVTSQLIDRGIIPMVGLAILFAGFWIERNTEGTVRRGWEDFVGLGALGLSAILGLAFLLPVPLLNFNSLRLLNNQAIEQINQEASQVESTLNARSQQIGSLIKDPQKLDEQLNQLDQVVKSGKVQGQQLAQLQGIQQQLQKFKQDPKTFQQDLQAAQTKLKSSKLEAENRAKSSLFRSGAKNIISSLCLAIGYLGIAWMGLTNITGSSRR